jgi:hypothetical protein
MSGSLKPPGPAYFHHASFWSMRLVMLHKRRTVSDTGGHRQACKVVPYLAQWAEMSPVVRQLLPTRGAHVAGLSTPHSHL